MKLFYCNIAELNDFRGAARLSPERTGTDGALPAAGRPEAVPCAGTSVACAFGEGSCARISLELCGKPYLPGGAFFNLSHSGNYAVLAVSPCEVGVDVEQVAPYSQAVAEKCFTAPEREWLSRQSCGQAFFKLWTGKESVMKATGLGLRLPPESFNILPYLTEFTGCRPKMVFAWFSLPGHEHAPANRNRAGNFSSCRSAGQRFLGDRHGADNTRKTVWIFPPHRTA